MTRYAIASMTPAALLALACLFGGIWPLCAVASITALVFFLDKLAPATPPLTANGQGVSIALALVHFPLLALGVWALAAPHLGPLDKVLIFTGLGLFCGQVSNSNAHELIHARGRVLFRLGVAVYVSLLHGHHVSAHLRVHHVHAATPDDPNSAPAGLGFWRYAARVLRQEFTAGFHADTKQRARATQKTSAVSHPYVVYVAGAALALCASFAIAGSAGVLAHLGIALYAQMQLLLSDYVQHYGLRRRILPNGRAEPIGPQHSWNAPQWYSSAMMLNAPLHSDHHMRPTRPYPALEVTDDMPRLPHSLPVMAVIALIPPLWHRVMRHRLRRWQNPA